MFLTFRKLFLRVTSILAITIIITTVVACGSDDNANVGIAPKVATVTVTTNAFTTPETSNIATAISVAPQPTLSPTAPIQANAALVKLPLNTEVNRAEQIVLGQVTNIGELVWNTPDNQEPIDLSDPKKLAEKYPVFPQQFAPIEITIFTSYKGSLKLGEKVTLLMGSAPGSKPFGASVNFPKLKEERVWFIGGVQDYRHGLGKTPLNFPAIQQYYLLKPDGKWVAPNDNILTIVELENTIRNPVPDAPSASRPIVPTPTPRVKPNQSVNLVELYELNKVQSIYVKGASISPSITDSGRIKSVVVTLDKPLTAVENPLTSQAAGVNDVVYVVFTLADGKTLGLEYNRRASTLTGTSPDIFRVPAPPNFGQVLGLN